MDRFLGARDPAEPAHGTVVNNFLSGLAAAVCCLPQAISFSTIAGVHPLNGMWAGFFMSLCNTLVGGRPGMVACSSAATAFILSDVTRDPRLGLGGMALVVLLCGALQAFVAALRLARFVSLVPHTVMLGFVNGLAVVIACQQVHEFRKVRREGPLSEDRVVLGMVLTMLVSLATTWLFPRVPGLGRLLPAPLAALAVAVAFSCGVSPWLPQRSLGQAAGASALGGGLEALPPWNFPPLGVSWGSVHLWKQVVVGGVRMAIVGLVESLVTLLLVDMITETRGSTSRECFGQSMGNLLCGIFGVQGGSALLGQTLLNVGAGGRGRLSGLTMAAGMFAGIVLLAPLVSKIPVAAVIGLMFYVSMNTFAWGTLGLVRRTLIQRSDAAMIIMVSVLTVFWDLASAVILGIIVSALVFAWNVSNSVRLEVSVDRAVQKRVFCLHGPLFFASSWSFQQSIDAERIKELRVALDFTSGSVLDHSAMEAVVAVVRQLRGAGKRVEVTGLGLGAQEHVFGETGVLAT